MTDLVSRPYNPSAEKCCIACVFGPTAGPHADWCDVLAVWLRGFDARKEQRKLQALVTRNEALREAITAVDPSYPLPDQIPGTERYTMAMRIPQGRNDNVPCMACCMGRDDHAEWCNAQSPAPAPEPHCANCVRHCGKRFAGRCPTPELYAAEARK